MALRPTHQMLPSLFDRLGEQKGARVWEGRQV